MKLIKKTFVFESDGEIEEFIHVLKRMILTKVSFQRRLTKDYFLHSGKASIPDYAKGHFKSKLIR